MGEVADDIVEGRCCANCNTLFDGEHGYPVLCKYCWSKASKEERKGYQEAFHMEV